MSGHGCGSRVVRADLWLADRCVLAGCHGSRRLRATAALITRAGRFFLRHAPVTPSPLAANGEPEGRKTGLDGAEHWGVWLVGFGRFGSCGHPLIGHQRSSGTCRGRNRRRHPMDSGLDLAGCTPGRTLIRLRLPDRGDDRRSRNVPKLSSPDAKGWPGRRGAAEPLWDTQGALPPAPPALLRDGPTSTPEGCGWDRAACQRRASTE